MIRVANDELSRHAQRLVRGPVSRADLALAFDESTASSAEVLVEGANFYPRMLEDIAAASSSIHINQFGFRPGAVGDRFAEALLAKARDGVPVRLVVDRQGSDPERGTKQLYDQLCAAGAEVCVVRATKPRSAAGPLGGGGALHWNLAGLGHIDHRKVVVVDGRIGWVGGAGIEDHFEDGRFHDLFVRVTGPVVSQLQLVFIASLRWLGAELDGIEGLFPDERAGHIPAVVLHNAPGRYRPITDAIASLLDGARETLDVVNPYVTDRRMIGRIEDAARRGFGEQAVELLGRNLPAEPAEARDENELELRDHGPRHTEEEVVEAAVLEVVLDPGAADPADTPVHEHDLAVVDMA